NVHGGNALVAQFLVERHVGIAIDGGDHRGLLAGGAELLDVGHDGLPVGMTERGVVDHDVVSGHALGLQVGLENLVGGAGVDIVGTGQHETLDATALFAHQVIDRGDGLLVGRGTGVEHVLGRFFALILDRVEHHAVELFHHRQYRFAGHRSPTAEDYVDLFLGQQLTGLFREQRPVGSGIHYHGLQLLTQQATFLVLLLHHHQYRVL